MSKNIVSPLDTFKKTEPPVGVRTRRRLITMMVERKCLINEYFSKHVVTALREYADAIEYQVNYFKDADPETVEQQEKKGLGLKLHEFKSSNECFIRVIAGVEDD